MNFALLDTSNLPCSIGTLLIAGDADSLQVIHFQRPGETTPPEAGWVPSSRGPVGEAVRQLREYLAGRRTAFDLPLAPWGTAFQRGVWRALQEIPYGETISYGELARRVANPKASRAVGSANGANPLAIVIPCHRVIAGDGTIGGFGGGLDIKQSLLALERRTLVSAGSVNDAPASDASVGDSSVSYGAVAGR